MKIAISGVTGCRNRGVEALVRPIVDELNVKYPTVDLTIYTGSEEYDKRRFRTEPVRIVKEGSNRLVRGIAGRLLKRLGIEAAPENRFDGWDHLLASNLLIVTGGDVFSSEYGDRSFDRHLTPMRVAHLHNVPYVLFAQSIGPFASVRHRESFLQVARYAALISVREERTHRYLLADLGLPPEQLQSVADPAFLLVPDPKAKEFASKELSRGKPLVALSISQAISSWTGLDHDRRLTTWATVVRRMIESWGVGILLIPHVQEPYADDTIACTEVWRKMSFDPRVRVLGEDCSAAEFKGIISECEMVVAERMHAGIAGLSSIVCTSLVAYSTKSRGIMEKMVGPELAGAGALIESVDFDNADVVWNKLRYMWDNRHAIRESLQVSVPVEQTHARRAFDFLPPVETTQ